MASVWTAFFIGFGIIAIASSASFKRGSCIISCGAYVDLTCPSGYECRSNGCGTQCFRTTSEQPPGCPLYKCSYNCPLGYIRDENGCETCECDYSLMPDVGSETA